MENEQLPSYILNTFGRTKHPYLVWDGINEIPSEIEYLLENYLDTNILRDFVSTVKKFDTIYLIGCGTSYYAATAGTYYFNNLAKIKANAYEAFEFLAYPPANLSNDLVIAISHTGSTASVIDAVNMAIASGAKVVGVTDVKDSKLAELSDIAILGMREREPSLPKTRSYEATLIKLFILAVLIAESKGTDIADYKNILTDLPPMLTQIINNYSLIEDICKKMQNVNNVYIVAAGPNIANAYEGALKFHECIQINAEAWELEEFMHGPWTAMDSNDLIILLASKGYAFDKTHKFLKAIENINPYIWIITNENDCFQEEENVTIIQGSDEYLNSFLSIIPIYQYIYCYALQNSINPDVMKLYDKKYLKTRLTLPR